MCADGTIISPGQTCEETCAANFQDYDADAKTCIPCTGNNYFNNNACEACPANLLPSSNRSACECPVGQALQGGSCQTCPDGMGVDDNGTGCETCASTQFSKDDGVCRSCPPGQKPNVAQTECLIQATCRNGTTIRPTLGEVCEETCSQRFSDYDPATQACVECEDGEFFNGAVCAGCPEDKLPNSEGSACVCPAGETNYRTQNGEICAPTLPGYPAESAAVYTFSRCELHGWSTLYNIDSQLRVAELCEIPVTITGGSTTPGALSETAPAPLRLTPGDEYDACLMRAHPLHENATSFQSCATIFGSPSTGVQFPIAAQYRENERVRVTILPNGQIQVLPSIFSVDVEVASDENVNKLIFGGVAAVALYAFLFSGGDVESLNWQPKAEMRHNNGRSYYAYGSRLGFASNDWSGYWEALQTRIGGNTGDWVYGAGAKWTGDVFAASLSNTTRGLNSDTAFSLSAQKQGRVWTLESSYVSDFRIDDLNTTWQNRLGVGAGTVYDKWTVTPRVELSWQDAKLTNDDLHFRMDVLREF